MVLRLFMAGLPVRWRVRRGGAVFACVLALLTPGLAQAQTNNDPLEPINRVIFGFNQILDGLILEPLSVLYGLVLPQPARQGIHNVLNNLKEPVVFANDLLQGQPDKAGDTLARFMINTSVGGLGLFDIATPLGHPQRWNDFGRTLGTYGVGSGPYLVLPFYGPSSPRDATGLAVDGFVLDPAGYLLPTSARMAQIGLGAVDTRYSYAATINDLKANSLDFYATTRTVYLQHRAAQIGGPATPGSNKAYEDIFNENVDNGSGGSSGGGAPSGK